MFDYVRWDARIKVPVTLNGWQTKDLGCDLQRVFI